MRRNFTIMPKKTRKSIKATGLVFLGLLCVVLLYIAGYVIFNATYTNFCNLRGSDRPWSFHTVDITDDTYRLGGIGNIGIGSTRREVVCAVRRRNVLNRLFDDNIPPSRYAFLNEPSSLPGSTLGFYRVRTWNSIEFLFDENDRVTKIRIAYMF